MGSGGANPLNMGKNKVKIYDRKEMKTTFSDVAGVEEAKDELRRSSTSCGTRRSTSGSADASPRACCCSAPEVGKTLLARAVAGEANVPFFFMSASEFVEMFVGLGAARVRELFQQAKEKAPALVFLDEIDTIGKGRSGAMGSGFGAHDEREQTLNQPGRDGRLRRVQGRGHHGRDQPARRARPAPCGPAASTARSSWARPARPRGDPARARARGAAETGVDLRNIAARTPGFTGADLENVVNEAALLARAATRTRSPSWSSTRRSIARRWAWSASRASCPRARRNARPSTRWATRWSR
jgi:cell division protease FtsH